MKLSVSAIIFGSIMSAVAGEADTPTALITPFPTSDSVPVPAPTSTCTGSTPDWVDVDGDGCGWYEASDLPGCPYWGDWAGIDDNTGEFIVGGSVANDNCCYCFGTAAPTPTSSPTITNAPFAFPTFSPTISGSPTAPTPKPSSPCTGNTPNWVDSFGDGCEWYEMYDEPGCPIHGNLYDGGMGLPSDNCCYCKMG